MVVAALRAQVVDLVASGVVPLEHPLHVLDLVAVDRLHVLGRVAHGDDPIVNVCRRMQPKKRVGREIEGGRERERKS